MRRRSRGFKENFTKKELSGDSCDQDYFFEYGKKIFGMFDDRVGADFSLELVV